MDAAAAPPRRLWLSSRETILLLTFAGLVAAFGVAAFVTRIYHHRRIVLAQEWFTRGSADLAAGRPSVALVDFETALIYAREDVSESQQRLYRLNLAEALASAGRIDEARAYLLDIWDSAPARAQVNLELARLAVRTGDDAEAKRYYDSAINGIWDGNADQVAASRRAARLELYHYLSSRGETVAAQAVLLALVAALPPDASLHTQVGELLLGAGDDQQALKQFQEVLQLQSNNTAALAGAGLASFHLGDDSTAVRYLRQASRDEPSSNNVSSSLAIAEAVLQLNPYRTGLGAGERAQRAAVSFETAKARLTDCATSHGLPLSVTPSSTAGGSSAPSPPPSDLQTLYGQTQKIKILASASRLARQPQQIEPLMDLVFAIEAATANVCGAPTHPQDAALQRIAQRVRGTH